MVEPELHLRLLAEDALLARASDHGMGTPLDAAAEVLVVAGVVSAETVAAIREEYEAASELRGDMHAHFRRIHAAQLASPAPAPAARPRVVTSAVDLQLPDHDVVVKYVLLGEDGCEVGAEVRPARRSRRVRNRGGLPLDWLQQVTLAAPDGTKAQASFGGGGSDESQRGAFTTDDALPIDSTWIELDGHRIPLDAPAPAVVARTEPNPTVDPIFDHLAGSLASADHWHGREGNLVEPGLAALIAVGAWAPDDPRAEHLRAIAEHRGQHAWHGHGGPVAPLPEGLPQPWRTALSTTTGRGKPPTGSWPVHACSPWFDDMAVLVGTIEAEAHGFALDVVVLNQAERTGDRSLRWWARDEQDRYHLGSYGDFSGSDRSSLGTVTFTPPLRPGAERLELLPTGPTQRAVISIELVAP